MDQCEEQEEKVGQGEEEHEEEAQVEEVKEEEAPVKEVDSGGEWDTDLETDSQVLTSHTDGGQHKAKPSRAELYLQACEQTGAVPVSSITRNLGDPDLNLNEYRLGPLGAKALAIFLQTDRTITNLELEYSAIGVEGTCYLMEMLKTNITIQSLNLSNNDLGLEGAKAISEMLADNYHIQRLKLSGNHFDDSAAKYLSDGLGLDFVLKELDLSHNKISGKGGHLGQILAADAVIEVLNLSWNDLSLQGAVALSDGLMVNSELKQLDLSFNSLSGASEMELLGKALALNRTLELLDLRCNHISDQAVTVLCKSLAANCTLRVLKLSLNYISHIGALVLLETVVNNMKSAVEEIDISTVFVHEDFLELLEKAREKRPGLDVRYSVMSYVTRNFSAQLTFQRYFEERKENIMDFFQSLDKGGTQKVQTSAFRKAVKEANIPLDQQQLGWLVRKLDKDCTSFIAYSKFAELFSGQKNH